MKKLRTRIHELNTVQGNPARNMDELIQRPNLVPREWGNYSRTGNSDGKFNQIDGYVWKRVLRWQRHRGGQRTRLGYERWPAQRLWDRGLHGLKGGAGNGPHYAAPCQ